jgi:hypothetical protein
MDSPASTAFGWDGPSVTPSAASAYDLTPMSATTPGTAMAERLVLQSPSTASDPGGDGGAPPFLPAHTYAYNKSISKAYNLSIYLVRELGVKWMIFFTSMSYVHLFVKERGFGVVPPVVLAAAATFLAAKVEAETTSGGRVRLARVVALSFEQGAAATAELREARAQQVLDAEMMLVHTLDFELVQKQPMTRLEELLGKGDGAVARYAKKLVSYTYCTPLCTKLTEVELAEAVVHFAADALGDAAALRALAVNGAASADVCRGVREVLLDYYIWNPNSRVQVPAVEQMVRERRKRARDAPGRLR